MKILRLILVLVVLTGLGSCVEDISNARFFEEDELTITAYLEKNNEDFSMLLELMERSEFKSAFNAYGPYTLFAFKNDAFQSYLTENGFGSVNDLSVNDAKILIRYHTIKSEISSSNLGLGKLPFKNLEDDELISSFDSTGLQGILINRDSKVVTRDVELSNGILHIIDKTMKPIVKSVAQKMEERDDLSIFMELVHQTGFYPILNKVYDTLATGDIKRRYFTVFVENNQIYNDMGISSFNDLVEHFDNTGGDFTSPDDTLNKFMANHIIGEKSIFIKDFQTGNYQSYYGELINFNVELSYQINLNGPPENQTFLSFVPDDFDFQAKNGVFHLVDDVLKIFYPEPVEVIWDFLDQPFARDLVRVNGQNSDAYPNLDNFPNMSGTITSVYYHYPYDVYGFLGRNALIFEAPDWDVTIHMPIKIVKGRYKMFMAYKKGPGRAVFQTLVNGVPVGEPVSMIGSYIVVEEEIGEVNLTETKEQDVRLVTVIGGQGQMDYIRFEPIN